MTRSGLEPTIYLTVGGSEKITVFGVTRSGLEPTIYLTLGESEKITVFGVTRSGLEPMIYLTLGESEKITFRTDEDLIEYVLPLFSFKFIFIVNGLCRL